MREHVGRDVGRDMELRQQHRSGDERVFDRFVRDHARPVLAYCLRRSTHADAHEAASAVCSNALRKFSDVPDGAAGLYSPFGVVRPGLSKQQAGRARAR